MWAARLLSEKLYFVLNFEWCSCNKGSFMYFSSFIFLVVSLSCVPVLLCLECRCLMPFMPLCGCLRLAILMGFPRPPSQLLFILFQARPPIRSLNLPSLRPLLSIQSLLSRNKRCNWEGKPTSFVGPIPSPQQVAASVSMLAFKRPICFCSWTTS